VAHFGKHKRAEIKLVHPDNLAHYRVVIKVPHWDWTLTVFVDRNNEEIAGGAYRFYPEPHGKKYEWSWARTETGIVLSQDHNGQPVVLRGFNFLRPSGHGTYHDAQRGSWQCGWHLARIKS
jgi:hypothetical protein